MLDDMGQINQRLDRFERSLDEMRAAMVQMAKTEERVSIVLEQTTTLFKQQRNHQERINRLERENATQAQSLSFFERFGWLIATAVAGVIGWWFKR